MRKTLDTHAAVKEWFDGLTEGRARDAYPRIQHAMHVRGTILTLFGAMQMVADPGSIEVNEVYGHACNLFWFTVDGRPYFCGYHNPHVVPGYMVLRDRNREGTELARFDDSIPAAHMFDIFLRLKPNVVLEPTAAAAPNTGTWTIRPM